MRQSGLFATPTQPTILVGDCGDVTYVPDFLAPDLAKQLFDELHESTTWQADSRMMYGRRVMVPRETAVRGDGKRQAWSPTLLIVRSLIEAHVGTAFDFVFINRYRDGNDSVTWHHDREGDADALGSGRRVIASLSLGATRMFELRPLKTSGLGHKKIGVDVADGDLIVMAGDTQLHWEHRVPKENRLVGERINLTFRQHRPREQGQV